MTTITRKTRILDADGRPFHVRVQTQAVRGKYDSAQTTSDNVRHWAQADALSADAANSPGVRKKLRERARYEITNNGWARSMVDTLAHETIGTGPRMQVLTGSPAADEWIEQRWTAWKQQIRLARKLRTMRKAKCGDGEGIAMFYSNPRIRGEAMLDLRTIETEQMCTPSPTYLLGEVDGIDLDENGNPLRYHILKRHPGGNEWGINPLEELDPPPSADELIHIFREDRPGQHRGVPEITPALPIFSRLRRYTLAVLQSAENVAELTAFLKTRQPDDGSGDAPNGSTDDEPASYEAFDAIDIERGMLSVLPEDTDVFQLDPKQPGATFVEFVQQCLAEAFACVCMPYAIGAQDSSNENFASGKLTRLGFKRAITVERELDWDPEILRIFWEWWREAKYAMPPDLRAEMRPQMDWIVLVFWDGVEDIDAEKAARARKVMLESGQKSYPSMYAEMGADYETEQTKQARALGLTLEEYRRRLANKLFPETRPQPAQGA